MNTNVWGIVFDELSSLCHAVMLADFQADRRGPRANDKVKRSERGCARAAEQVFRTRELMPSSLVAKSESRVERTFATFSGAKDTESRSSWVQLGRVGTENEGLGDTRFGSEHRIEAFSLLTSGVGCDAI